MKAVRRILFESNHLVVEYQDLSRERRDFYDKQIRFRDAPVNQQNGREYWVVSPDELSSLFSWSWHVRWLTEF
jgi:hypothetical protein